MKVEIIGEKEWILEPQSKFEGRFFLVRKQTEVKVNQEKVNIALIHNEEEIDKIKTNFMAPLNK